LDFSNTSIKLDSNNYPHIVCYDITGGSNDLAYVKWNGLVWTITGLDNSGDVGGSCSIAVDTMTNSPYVAYRDDSNGKIKFDVWVTTPTNFAGTAVSTYSIGWTWSDVEDNESNYFCVYLGR